MVPVGFREDDGSGPCPERSRLEVGVGSRNIVLVTVDSLRWDAVGFGGAVRVRTPALDRFAGSGTVFSLAIANGPRTQASFPSILCSLYPLVAGEREGLPSEAATLGEVLQGAGYRTAAFNPSNPFLTRETGYQRGFDLFVDFWDVHPRRGAAGRSGSTKALRRRFHDAIGRRSLAALMLYQAALQGEGGQYLTGPVIAEQGLAWAREQEEPFFLWLHFMDVHYPYTPLPGQRTAVDRLRYLAALGLLTAGRRARAHRELRRLYDRRVELVDGILGRFLDGLAAAGLEKSTVVVFTSDHGERFGEHGAYAHGPDLYDELLRVPLVIRGPGVPVALEVRAQVGLIDLAPGLLDMMEIQAPSSFMGRSFLPLLNGGESGDDAHVFSEAMHSGRRESRTGVPDRFRVMSCRNPRWKLIVDEEGPSEELYDLEHDPGERTNLLLEREDVARELRDRLEEHVELIHREAARYEGRRGGRIADGDDEVRRRLAALGYL